MTLINEQMIMNTWASFDNTFYVALNNNGTD